MHHFEMERRKREETILLSLKKLDFLTSSQIQIIHNLKSDRNTLRVLKRMEEYICSFRDGEKIYYLNSKGRELVGCDKIRKKTGNVQHYIMRNYIYIANGCPPTWKNEIRFRSIGKSKQDSVICVPDALFMQGDTYIIVEVDNTQTMKENQSKIERYRKLKDRGAFGKMLPKFIWITTTEYKKQEILKISEGLQTQVYTILDFKGGK